MSREFNLGEVVLSENYGWGVVVEVGWCSGNLKIAFESDPNGDVDWWFSSDRVTKLQEVM